LSRYGVPHFSDQGPMGNSPNGTRLQAVLSHDAVVRKDDPDRTYIFPFPPSFFVVSRLRCRCFLQALPLVPRRILVWRVSFVTMVCMIRCRGDLLYTMCPLTPLGRSLPNNKDLNCIFLNMGMDTHFPKKMLFFLFCPRLPPHSCTARVTPLTD